ncbi:MAG: hypothetical protein RBS80_27440 [Thermoguttaceae bacterium]|jgi:hypothetical protein|nr:hypothetical protein [Thermoguttaceae bacterium]
MSNRRQHFRRRLLFDQRQTGISVFSPKGIKHTTHRQGCLCLLCQTMRILQMTTYSQFGIYRIPMEQQLFLTAQLKRFNAESIQLGFSRNLQCVERIPDSTKVPILKAFRHVSCGCQPLQHVRLVVSPPTHMSADWHHTPRQVAKSLLPHILDITNDAWEEVGGL